MTIISLFGGTEKNNLRDFVLFIQIMVKVFKRLKIGYVLKLYYLRLLMFLNILNDGKKDRLNIALVHDLEVPIHKKIHELSKGNQQKLSIMTALMGNPHVLIFDEPSIRSG